MSKTKPEWFNGFIKLESHHRKPQWSRYVYFPDYYDIYTDDNLGCKSYTLNPKPNNINPSFVDYYANSETRHFEVDTKHKLACSIMGGVSVYNSDTETSKYYRTLYSTGDYIVRQLNENDIEQAQQILKEAKACRIIGGTTLTKSKIVTEINRGFLVAPIDSEGNLQGLQGFSFHKQQVSPEPLTYICEAARGLGIFNIYHDIVVEVGEELNAEYLYCLTMPNNEKMAQIYKSYGYEEQDEPKYINQYGNMVPLRVFHFPIKNEQQTFF